MVGHLFREQQLQQQRVPQLVVVHQQRYLPFEKYWDDVVDNAVAVGSWGRVGTLWLLQSV